jgi:type II secretory pathway pseudopilin PulG
MALPGGFYARIARVPCEKGGAACRTAVANCPNRSEGAQGAARRRGEVGASLRCEALSAAKPAALNPSWADGICSREERGYALVALMIMVTVILVSLTQALPDIYQNVEREREQEAIFRGEQYARAIYLFHRTLGRYPSSIKELLSTNGMRFLRQAYRDPLSSNGRWHFIHASASGIILDSQNQTVSPASPPGGSPSGPALPGQINNGASTLGSSPQANGSGSTFGPSAQANSPLSGFGATTPGAQQSTANGTKKKGPPKLAADCKAPESSDSSSPAQTGQLFGATIVGVAPCNLHASIRILNKKNHYYQWEFLGMNYVPYTIPQVQTLQPSSSSPNSPMGQPQPLGAPTNSGSPGAQNNSSQPGQNQNFN